MSRSYNVIDADGHVLEPFTLWNDYMDPRYRERAPKLTSIEVRLKDIRDGAVECYRVCRKFLLVKCMDMVEGGRLRWQTDMVSDVIQAAGGQKVDRFEYLKPWRPQPPGRRQITSRRNYSTLLVFRKP